MCLFDVYKPISFGRCLNTATHTGPSLIQDPIRIAPLHGLRMETSERIIHWVRLLVCMNLAKSGKVTRKQLQIVTYHWQGPILHAPTTMVIPGGGVVFSYLRENLCSAGGRLLWPAPAKLATASKPTFFLGHHTHTHTPHTSFCPYLHWQVLKESAGLPGKAPFFSLVCWQHMSPCAARVSFVTAVVQPALVRPMVLPNGCPSPKCGQSMELTWPLLRN